MHKAYSICPKNREILSWDLGLLRYERSKCEYITVTTTNQRVKKPFDLLHAVADRVRYNY